MAPPNATLTSLSHRLEVVEALRPEKRPPAAGLPKSAQSNCFSHTNLPEAVESDIMFTQKGKELLLTASVDRIVVSFVDGGFDVAVFFAYVEKLLYFSGGVV
ncbi:hypothetical protein RRF57_002687 [Xylaria bambusicola]|uniref:Uncharacterized protein n=1 Tax=Xylaria bambusicola TaxID=326684 RepID=A0AAN7Z214_9PEZI